MPSHSRTAFHPRRLPNSPPAAIPDLITWTRHTAAQPGQPRELYRVQYVDRDGDVTTRELELKRLGTLDGEAYMGVMHDGRFKTMRLSRILQVEQLSSGHEPSLRIFPTYAHRLPPWPLPGAVLRVPTVKGNRTWLVNLSTYTCACPEQKRERRARGYEPPQLGAICPHLARAILDHLPAGTPGWTPELLMFLGDPTKISLANLR